MAQMGLAGITGFVVIVAYLQVVLLSDTPWHMSEYARTSQSVPWETGLAFLVLGGGAIAVALTILVPGTGLSGWGAKALQASMLGGIVLVIFPADRATMSPTVVGTIHSFAAAPTFLLLGAAMLLLRPSKDAAWTGFARWSNRLGATALALGAGYLALDLTHNAWVALAQRLLVGTILFWLVICALQVLQVAKARAVVAARVTRRREPI